MVGISDPPVKARRLLAGNSVPKKSRLLQGSKAGTSSVSGKLGSSSLESHHQWIFFNAETV